MKLAGSSTVFDQSGSGPTAKMLDITAPEIGVEVIVNHIRNVIHVNVDGCCVLRICQIPSKIHLTHQGAA